MGVSLRSLSVFVIQIAEKISCAELKQFWDHFEKVTAPFAQKDSVSDRDYNYLCQGGIKIATVCLSVCPSYSEKSKGIYVT